MKSNKTQAVPAGKNKTAIILALYAAAAVITLLGVFFFIYSILSNATFQVLNVQVPGFVFGLCVVYLGIRNYLAVKKLRPELFKNSSRFSWKNFEILRKKSRKSGAR